MALSPGSVVTHEQEVAALWKVIHEMKATMVQREAKGHVSQRLGSPAERPITADEQAPPSPTRRVRERSVDEQGLIESSGIPVQNEVTVPMQLEMSADGPPEQLLEEDRDVVVAALCSRSSRTPSN